MSMTETDAKEKWCPFARVGGGQGMDGSSYNRIEHHGGDISHGIATCLGPVCMAWRWQSRFGTDPDNPQNCAVLPSTHGYCGLAGRPE